MLRSFARLPALLLALLAGLFAPQRAEAQLCFAYYDLDRLYDTIPSPFYNDSDYTPAGRYAWDSRRYVRKIRDAAAVIDSLGLPLVALYGVENEQVARDLSAACAGDYVYLHRTLNTLDGMDFVLLYYADCFRPLRCETGRRALCIDGILRRPAAAGGFRRDTVAILLTADPETAPHQLRDLCDRDDRGGRGDLRDGQRRRLLLAAGRLDALRAADFGLKDRLAAAARRGHGSRRRRGGWQMRDRIFTSPELGCRPGQVYLRRFLLDGGSGEPLPTYDAHRYRGGRSRNLPVWCRIE